MIRTALLVILVTSSLSVFCGPTSAQGTAKAGAKMKNSIAMAFAWVEPGTFTMGSSGRCVDSRPQRTVAVESGFWLSCSEVTQQQFEKVMGWTPYPPTNPDGAANFISWYDAISFCMRLSELDGRSYRLPSEAEWEYACRAGTQTERYGPLEAIAWVALREQRSPAVVGAKQANSWGMYDMLGNVAEWCEDRWHDTYHGAPATAVPWTNDGVDGVGVIRGGSLMEAPLRSMASERMWSPRRSREAHVGFRVLWQEKTSSSPMLPPPPKVKTPPRVTERYENGLGMAFVPVPAGVLVVEPLDDDSREQSIPIEAHLMSSCEVTVGQYMELVVEGGLRPPEWKHWRRLIDEYVEERRLPSTEAEGYRKELLAALSHRQAPVVGISYADCALFCQRLSEREGLTYRLPSSAEWEYAARAGVAQPALVDDYAWYERTARQRPHPVATKQANPWGLYDMLGNAAEICTRLDEGKPAPNDWFQLSRGGSWSSMVHDCTPRMRKTIERNEVDYNTGFRVVLVP